MRKILIILLSVICLNITACTRHENQITKLSFVKNYKVHENGVEVWLMSETKEDIGGAFIKHENIYPCEEDVSRVVTLCCSHGQIIYGEYLYFNKEDYKEYIKERYDID